MDKALLKEGETVLVNGGIESLVSQIAKAAVGETGKAVGLCSGVNRELVKVLGADVVCRIIFLLSRCTS